MQNKLSKPDVALMSLALSVSKKTGVVATIKYGGIFLSNNDIEMELSLVGDVDEFQLIFIDGIVRYWKFSIPLSKLLDVKEIENTIFAVLGVKPIKADMKPIVSIPYNYFKRMIHAGVLNLDCFFTPTSSEKYLNYCFFIKKNKYQFKIIANNKASYTSEIYLILRDGKGNEDL